MLFKLKRIEREVGLSPHDDKRYLLPDTIDTWPHGYWKIPKEDVSETALNTLDPVEEHDEIMISEDSNTPALNTLDPVEQDDEIMIIEGSDSEYKEGRASPRNNFV